MAKHQFQAQLQAQGMVVGHAHHGHLVPLHRLLVGWVGRILAAKK